MGFYWNLYSFHVHPLLSSLEPNHLRYAPHALTMPLKPKLASDMAAAFSPPCAVLKGGATVPTQLMDTAIAAAILTQIS